jgi:hypothetical protein
MPTAAARKRSLPDGTVLAPRPVTLDGLRWVAFASPVSVPVTSVTAYSRTGPIATAIPFSGPSGRSGPIFAAWLRPGQAGAARVTRTIASGTAGGRAWQLTAYVGPWGTCVAGGDGQLCSAQVTPVNRGIAEMGGMGLSSPGELVWGAAAASVSYLIVTPEDGTAMRIGVTTVGPQKYFACYLRHAPSQADRWTAYNSAGQPVASGSLG